jgi:hypothetical protein
MIVFSFLLLWFLALLFIFLDFLFELYEIPIILLVIIDKTTLLSLKCPYLRE